MTDDELSELNAATDALVDVADRYAALRDSTARVADALRRDQVFEVIAPEFDLSPAEPEPTMGTGTLSWTASYTPRSWTIAAPNLHTYYPTIALSEEGTAPMPTVAAAEPEAPSEYITPRRETARYPASTRPARLVFAGMPIKVNISPIDTLNTLPRARYVARRDGGWEPVSPETLYFSNSGNAFMPGDTVPAITLLSRTREPEIVPLTDQRIAEALDLGDEAIAVDTFYPASRMNAPDIRVLSVLRMAPRRNRRGPTSAATAANDYAWALLMRALTTENSVALLRLVVDDYPRYVLLDGSGLLHVLLYADEYTQTESDWWAACDRALRRVPVQDVDAALSIARRAVVAGSLGPFPALTVDGYQRRISALVSRLRAAMTAEPVEPQDSDEDGSEMAERPRRRRRRYQTARPGGIPSVEQVLVRLRNAMTPRPSRAQTPTVEQTPNLQPRRRRRATAMTVDDMTVATPDPAINVMAEPVSLDAARQVWAVSNSARIRETSVF